MTGNLPERRRLSTAKIQFALLVSGSAIWPLTGGAGHDLPDCLNDQTHRVHIANDVKKRRLAMLNWQGANVSIATAIVWHKDR